MTSPPFHSSKSECSDYHLNAFTLLELLLVIAVVAVLAGIILFALNPAKRLDDANSAQVQSKSNDLRKAVESFAIANSGSMPTYLAAQQSYGIYDICKQGQNTNCINLDELVTSGYISEIPVDDGGDTSVISGYKIEYNPAKKNVQVYSTANYTKYVENGTTLSAGMVGYWKMNENTGTTTSDASGNGNTGTLTNGTIWGAGKYSYGTGFDGINDYINVGNSSSLEMGMQDWTMSAWVKTSDTTNRMRVITRQATGYYFMGFGLSNTLYYGIYDGTNSVIREVVSAASYRDNNWHNYVITIDRDSATGFNVYMDGVLLETRNPTAVGNVVPVAPTNIGMYSPSTQPFNGQVDEVRIYNRALNFDEVTALYNYAPTAVAQWKFDEGTGTVATDSSGNGFNGTLTNGPTWVGGRYGNAINFDGSNDYISYGALTNANGWNTISAGAWVKTSVSGNLSVVNEWSGNANYALQMQPGGQLNVFVSSTWHNSVLPSGINDNAWHHVFMTYDGATVKVYLDGAQVYALSESGTVGSCSTCLQKIGANANASEVVGSYYSGQMDDVRLYNYALTALQVQKVMRNEI